MASGSPERRSRTWEKKLKYKKDEEIRDAARLVRARLMGKSLVDSNDTHIILPRNR